MTDWSKNGRSSRNRGHAFERMVAKELNRLFEGKCKFMRTPCSGGHGIDGDVYEHQDHVTEWSNINIYCRTQVDLSFEAFICDKTCKMKRWMEETGNDSMWIFRTKPGRVFCLIHINRLLSTAGLEGYAAYGEYVIFDLERLPSMQLNLNKVVSDVQCNSQ